MLYRFVVVVGVVVSGGGIVEAAGASGIVWPEEGIVGCSLTLGFVGGLVDGID